MKRIAIKHLIISMQP